MRRMFLLAVPVLVFGGACSDSAPDEGAAPATDASPAAAAPAAVSIETFQFTPKRLTVPVGTTVTFTNNDSILHTATAEGRFDLQLADKGSTGTYTFSEAGTFQYRCTRHPGMDATVVVQ